MAEKHIESTHNPIIKHLLALRKKSVREETRSFIIEGERELIRAQQAKVPFKEVYYCPSLMTEQGKKILQTIDPSSLLSLSERAFNKVTYRENPFPLFAIASFLEKPLSIIPKPLFVLGEGLEKPGNLGAILRVIDGAGGSGLIVTNPLIDLYNPNVIRASTGTLFTTRCTVTDNEQAYQLLKKQNIQTIAAAPNSSKSYTEIDYTQPSCIIVGSEAHGLSPFWLEHASERVSIPMHGVADSLNVTTATTIILYEAERQRSQHSL